MSTITLSMIVKNEEKYLRGCLESVEGVADEIVIVDTGSTDKTLEIAKEFNAKIYHFEWINDFSAARNFALSKSTGNWILYLDADERLQENSKSLVKNIVKKQKKLGVYCSIENIINSKDQPIYMQYPRFFSNSSKIQFNGKAHEQIEFSLVKNGYKLIKSQITITHLGYAAEEDILRQKASRNLDLLLGEYSEKPTAYLAYQITNSYLVLGDYHKSFNYANKALEISGLSVELRSICYMNIVEYYMNSQNFMKAEEICLKALNENRRHPIINIIASQIYEKLNENKKALEFCKISFKENNNLKKSERKKNVLDIILKDKDIIYHGILLALKLQDLSELNGILLKLKKLSNDEYLLINSILQEEKIDNQYIYKLKNLLNDVKVNLIYEIFKYCSDNKFKDNFYNEIYNDYKHEKEFLSNYGEFLLNNGKFKEAEKIFNNILTIEKNNPAIYFYLISIYLQTNQLEKIKDVIENAELVIQLNSPFYNKLVELKTKIAPLYS